MRHLEETSPVEVEYGRRALGDLTAVGLRNVEAEGRCPIVRGGAPLAAHFLRLTLEKLREPVVSAGRVTLATFKEAFSRRVDSGIHQSSPATAGSWGYPP